MINMVIKHISGSVIRKVSQEPIVNVCFIGYNAKQLMQNKIKSNFS